MSLEKNDENELNPKDLVFVLAIAGRIDAQGRLLAEHLDKDRQIYYSYAILDSLSSSYSMFKYFFDVLMPDSSSDYLHEVMMSPGGIAAISAESLFLVGFSFLACHYDGEQEGSYKKWIADAWPYVRDVVKGLKNGYKGWRGFVTATHLLGGHDIKYLLAPIGLGLGVLAALNRYLYRDIVEKRKTMMIDNKEILKGLARSASLSEEKRARFLRKIKCQSLSSRSWSFAYAALGGTVDGLYLYFGILGLSSLSPPLAIVLVSLCVFYTVSCIITRMYEEYDFQLKLLVSQTKCQLAIVTKQLQSTYEEFCILKNNPDEAERLVALKAHLQSLISEFEEHRCKLNEQVNQGYFSAMLFGLKNGLYAYGALASALFFAVALLNFAGLALPPVLLLSIVSTGIAFMIGFIIHSLSNYQHLNKQPKDEERPYARLKEIKDQLAQQEAQVFVDKEDFVASLKDGLILDAPPVTYFQEWFEVFRSLFTGFVKGQKFMDFLCNPLQEMDAQAHYHDTPFMYVLGVINAIGFGAILALRALTRGLGRKPLGDFDMATQLIVPMRLELDESHDEALHEQNQAPLSPYTDALESIATSVASQGEGNPIEVKDVIIDGIVQIEGAGEPQKQDLSRSTPKGHSALATAAYSFWGNNSRSSFKIPDHYPPISAHEDEGDGEIISSEHTTQDSMMNHCTF